MRQDIKEIYLRHWKTVWNICYPYFMNPADTEDAVQETFVRLALCEKTFSDEDHEKAFLIVTARNVCRDELKSARRKNLPLETAEAVPSPQSGTDDTLRAIRTLPDRLSTALYLYYYEGYSTASIARMLNKKESTVRSDLRRGRLKLRTFLEETE
ncbi:MAG: sigma-70 family RNA polymerase sigma factor [Clostridia bacterium]|nr:sigma-70 family RNA polymerase sigma factor [Clostridia bacterium]